MLIGWPIFPHKQFGFLETFKYVFRAQKQPMITNRGKFHNCVNKRVGIGGLGGLGGL